MKFDIMTLFPELVKTVLNESVIGRAQKSGAIEINCHNIRDFSKDKHRRVDDTPYGGGKGMLMMAPPIYDCYKYIIDKNDDILTRKVIFMSPSGAVFNQKKAEELSKYDDNNDSLITKDDASFKKLQLWCDMNKNGITDEGELKSLTEAGITELSTSVTAQYDENGNLLEDKHGNTIGLVGYFKMLVEQVVDGVKTLVETVRTMIDVLFNTITL